MGVLVSAVAVRSADADEVLDVFLSMMRGLGHRREPLAGPDPTSPYGDSNDVFYAAPGTGWATLVPHYVVPAEKLAIELTRRLDTVSSAVTIYEDVLWMHHLVEHGEELDRFVNLPGYFGPGEFDDSWTGDASLVARTVGTDPAELAPYFRQVSLPRARSRWRRPPKAHAEDEYDLLTGWVVTELWRRMGISWPDPAAASTIRVPLGEAGTDALSVWLRSP